MELTEGLRIPADERADGVDETARSTALVFQLLEAGATAVTQFDHVRVDQVATAKLGGFVLVLGVEQRGQQADCAEVTFETLLETPTSVTHVHIRTVSRRSFDQLVEARNRVLRKLDIA